MALHVPLDLSVPEAHHARTSFDRVSSFATTCDFFLGDSFSLCLP